MNTTVNRIYTLGYRPKPHPILSGMLSLVDIFSPSVRAHRYFRSDEEAMRHDWNAVGRDLYDAMNSLSK